MKGYLQVDERTTLITEDGIPVAVRSTARDLDRAMNNAAQYYGEPLDCGSWEQIGKEDGWCLSRGSCWQANVWPAGRVS